MVGSQLSVKWQPGVLRAALAVVLIAAGAVLLGKANTAVVPYALGFSAIGIVGLFAAQILFRKEVERIRRSRSWMRRAVASHGDEIERHQAMEAELAARSRTRAQPVHAAADD